MDERDQIIQSLRTENAELVAQNRTLMLRVEALERRLKLDSNNSSKPPAADPNKKPRTKTLRPKGDKKPGGQPGHKGKTLLQVEQPDHIVVHPVTQCTSCCSDLSSVTPCQIQKRQVFDLPVPSIEVTEHQIEHKKCVSCGCINRAPFPQDVTAPVQYGSRIRALSVYFNQQQLIPEDRVSDIFRDVFGVSIAAATIAANGISAAKILKGWLADLEQHLASRFVKHLDETGFRIASITQWLHVMCDPSSTLYRIAKKRGEMFTGLSGIVVHDHFKSYYGLLGVLHALCNAHHLRELQALVEIEKEEWAYKMAALLRIANRNRKRASWVDRVYTTLVNQGLAYHENLPSMSTGKKRGRLKRRIGHNLLRRLQSHKTEVLRFLQNSQVPFTNNQAEQDIRMMKVRMKISGSFRSVEGACTFASIRSFTSTCFKRGLNLFEAISGIFQGSLPPVIYSAALAC